MSFSVDQFIADCVAAGDETTDHTGAAVRQVVERAVSDPASIAATLGHPRDMPVIQTWHNTDSLTVLHVVWPPTASLTPHDHLMWATIGLYGGREDNEMFRRLPDGTLEHRRSATLNAGDTTLLGADAVHSVANPSREWTGAIHVYGGNFFRDGRSIWHDPASQALPFDAQELREALSAASDRATVMEHEPGM